jgi:hypothetical protein
MDLVLRHSPDETFQVEVMDELVAKFRRLAELWSLLEQTGTRICDLLLGLPLGQARWADRLAEATGRLRAEIVARRVVDAELAALWTLAVQVRDMVLDNIDEPSSLAACLSMEVELLEGRIETMAAIGVRWGTKFALVATLSHFLEMKIDLELLGSGHNDDLREDQADGLWSQMLAALDSLASCVPSSVTRNPPDSVGE